MATPTNFDPNNYAEFYQEALRKGEENARNIATQTMNLAKGSAMEQTRDQGFALGQASKFGDTQNYRDKIMGDIEQKAELDRVKMLGEQSQKEQANMTNQQNVLTGLGSALLQMKLAKEAAKSSGGGSGGYSPNKLSKETLDKLMGNPLSTVAGIDTKMPEVTKKEESGFWKAADWLAPLISGLGAVAAFTPAAPAAPRLLWGGRALAAADATRSVVKGDVTQGMEEALGVLGGGIGGKVVGKVGAKYIPSVFNKIPVSTRSKIKGLFIKKP